jgi:hypothetical protein
MMQFPVLSQYFLLTYKVKVITVLSNCPKLHQSSFSHLVSVLVTNSPILGDKFLSFSTPLRMGLIKKKKKKPWFSLEHIQNLQWQLL